MIVKIEDKIYNAEEIAIMLVLSDDELKQICNMPEYYHRYAMYPDGWKTNEEVLNWMDELPEEVIKDYDLK